MLGRQEDISFLPEVVSQNYWPDSCLDLSLVLDVLREDTACPRFRGVSSHTGWASGPEPQALVSKARSRPRHTALCWTG